MERFSVVNIFIILEFNVSLSQQSEENILLSSLLMSV